MRALGLRPGVLHDPSLHHRIVTKAVLSFELGSMASAISTCLIAGLVALGLIAAIPMQAGWGLAAWMIAGGTAFIALAGMAPVRAASPAAAHALLLLLAMLGLTGSLLIKAGQPSDFGIYWRCGAAVGAPLGEWLQACQSAYLPPSSIYWRRSLFYSTIILGLGGDYGWLRGVNAGLFALMLLAVHRGALLEGGARFAFIALLATATLPEFWFALPLVTSDHMALPCVVLTLAAMARMQRAAPPPWLGPALGVLIFLADQGRSLGVLMALALLLLLLMGLGTFRARLLVVGLALSTHVMLLFGLQAFLAGLPANPGGFLQFLAARDLSRPNDFANLYQFVFNVWPIIPAEETTRYGLIRILAEFSGNAGQVFVYLQERLSVTFGGNGYYFFVANPLPDNADSEVLTGSTLGWSLSVHAHLGLLMRPVMGAAVVGALLAHDIPLVRAALCWVGIFFLVIIGLGEVQPRYVVLIWPAIAILAAAPFLPRPAGWRPALRSTAPPVLCGTALLILLAAYATLAPLARDHLAWPLRGVSALITEECPVPAGLEVGNRSVTLRLSAEASCAILRLPVPAGWREAGIALNRGELVWRFQQPADFPARFRFSPSGPDGALGREMATWNTVPLPTDGSELLFRLDRTAPGAAEIILQLPLRLQ